MKELLYEKKKKNVLYVRRGKNGFVTSLEIRETNFVKEQMSYVYNTCLYICFKSIYSTYTIDTVTKKKKEKFKIMTAVFIFVIYK